MSLKPTSLKIKYPVTMGRTGLQNIENLQIYDMIWGMCHLNRFTGKTDRPISLAAHSLHCWEIANYWQPDNEPLKLYALLHDLPEAYYGDFPGFLKSYLGAEFEYAIKEMDDIVLEQVGLTKKDRIVMHDDLKRVDNNSLAIEAMYGFDKAEPYHWPPMEFLTEDDTLASILMDDAIGSYNSIVSILIGAAEYNETLGNLLDRHSSYNHPRRRAVPPCIGHALQAG